MNNQTTSHAVSDANEAEVAQTPSISQPTRQARRARKFLARPVGPATSGQVKSTIVPPISNSGVSCRTVEKTADSDDHDHLVACDTLTKMELRRRYPAEANSHRNMLSRQKSSGALVHSDFHEFVSFLRHVGPMPAKGATLDRIDNTDPEYAPGKVRWADKRTQNNNKSDTRVFHCSRTGYAYTASRLAKLQGVSPSCIRKRAERGWTDDEIIEKGCSSDPRRGRQSPVSSLAGNPNDASRPAVTLKGLQFRQTAEEYRRAREAGEPEAIMAPYEDVPDLFEQHFVGITPEKYERHFARHWPTARPHVDYSRLPASQQALIAKIDPEYMAALAKKAVALSSLTEKL